MSIHKSCGKHIYWFKKTNGKMHRPLEAVMSGYWVIGGVVQDSNMTIYKEHICDPEDVEKWKDLTEKEQVQREEYEMALRRAQIDALTRPCKKDNCNAKIGEACINLNELKKGNIQRTRWPHEERMTSGES